MGLLDSLGYGNQGGYGGLLDMLMYPSPINKPQDVPQPLYDAMGTPFAAGPQNATDPFGPLPQQAQWAKQFAPQAASAAPSPFTGGAPAPPVQFSAGPTMQPPQSPTAPAAEPQQEPTRMLGIGGYQMPQIGSVADYTPDPAAIPQNAQPAQGQLPQQPRGQSQQLPPALGGGMGGGVGDRLMAGVQNFANAGGPLQALAGGLSGLVSGNRTDAAGVAQQNLSAQYRALVPTLGPEKAMLAVMNPEAGKVLIEQALSNKQKFTEIGVDSNGTKQYGFVNDRDQTVQPYAMAGSERPTAIAGPDGKLIQMPEGADPKIWRNEITRINADVAAGKKTGEQATAEIFANKMELSNKALDGLANQGTSLTGKIASGLPLGNYVQSPEYQKYKQASSNFITALLRKESGAAIGKEEFTRYDKEYMPQPGDGPEVLAQKTEARRVAIESMKKGAGPGYKSPTESPASSLPSGWSVRVR